MEYAGQVGEIEKELKQAKQAAQHARAKYLGHLVLKEAWAEIKEQKFIVEGASSEEERASFLQELYSWHERICIAECQALNLSGLKIPEQPPLNRHFVDTTVVPLVEAQLAQSCQTLVDCLEIPCAVEDLGNEVISLSIEVESMDQEFQSLTLRHAEHLFRFEEVLDGYVYAKGQWPAIDTVRTERLHCELLAEEMQCAKAKMRMIQEELLMDTYSEEKVAALKRMRAQLEEERVQSTKAIKEMKERLSGFKKIQRKVASFVEEYDDTCEELTSIQQALKVFKID